MQITINSIVDAPIEDVWRANTIPEDIMQWNAASDDWHTVKANVDLRIGGAFLPVWKQKMAVPALILLVPTPT
jgi:uncharacterized protein YndB with AHSA1/START domain